MKHPVVGTIALLAILAGGAYIGWQFKDRRVEGVRNTSGPAARAALQASLGLELPRSAYDPSCFEEDLEKTKLVFAGFDIPAIELPDLLSQLHDSNLTLPGFQELTSDNTLFESMKLQSSKVDPRHVWWKLEELKNPRCASRTGRRNSNQLVWRVQVCAGETSASNYRVYLAFSEEPAEAAAK